MKAVKLVLSRRTTGSAFQIHRLGLHEMMHPGLVDRAEGTGDYLFMLFHSEVRVQSRDEDSLWPASSMMIWTPGDSHFYGNIATSWDHSWFHCAGSAIEPILRANHLPLGRRIRVSDSSIMEKFLMETVAELNGWQRPDDKILQNLFENFVRGLARQLHANEGLLVPPSLLDLRGYVEQHFTEPLHLPDLAKRARRSAPNLCMEFKRCFGVPIIQYIIQLRMNQACYFLRDQNRRIGEIAEAVGYPDLATFSKMFKRHFGISPRTFRERYSQAGNAVEESGTGKNQRFLG